MGRSTHDHPQISSMKTLNTKSRPSSIIASSGNGADFNT